MAIEQSELSKKLAAAFKDDIAGDKRAKFTREMMKSYHEGTEPPLVEGAGIPLITPSVLPERENSFSR